MSGIEKWTQPDNLELLSCWARDGYTDVEIAKKMGISRQSLCNYRSKNPELDKAIRIGKEVVDYKVESALLKAALGSKTEELEITFVYKKTQLVRTEKKKTIRYQPPNVLACQTWLFNRQRDKWKRNQDNEIIETDDRSINITIKRSGNNIEVGEE